MSTKTLAKSINALVLACLLSVVCFGVNTKAVTVTSHPVNGEYKDYTYDTKDNLVQHLFTLSSSGTTTITIQTYFNTSAYIISNVYTERDAYDGNAGILGTPDAPVTQTFKLDLEAGSYFVQLKNSENANIPTGSYRIKISQDVSGATEIEPNDNFAQAMSLNNASPVTGFISLDNPCDFYKISVPSDQKVALTMTLYDNAESSISKNVTLYNADFEQQDVLFFYGATIGSSVTKEIRLKKGTYYIKVDNAGLHQYCGKYQIKWDRAPVFAEAITVSGETSVNAGKQITLKATVTPADTDNPTVTWTSSDPSVAAVNSAGVVTGNKIGKATIIATSTDGSKVSGSYNICVGPKKVTGLKVKAKGNKKVQIRFAKQKGITKIQVQYAKKKTFKNAKKKSVKVSSNTKKTTVKLKKGTYYVRVRAITKLDGKTYYGDWSNAKRVRIK